MLLALADLARDAKSVDCMSFLGCAKTDKLMPLQGTIMKVGLRYQKYFNINMPNSLSESTLLPGIHKSET